MTCRDVEILLQLAADGEITDEERFTLNAHLDDCVACRRKEAWLELLDEQFPAALSSGLEQSGELADAVVEALGTPRSVRTLASVESSSVSRSTAKPARKKGLFSRVVASLWSRRKRKLAKAKRAQEREGWIDASVSALQRTPTSLEGFRAARQGVSSAVSGPMRALKWVAGVWPRRGR